jgi:hypothetical protein
LALSTIFLERALSSRQFTTVTASAKSTTTPITKAEAQSDALAREKRSKHEHVRSASFHNTRQEA